MKIKIYLNNGEVNDTDVGRISVPDVAIRLLNTNDADEINFILFENSKGIKEIYKQINKNYDGLRIYKRLTIEQLIGKVLNEFMKVQSFTRKFNSFVEDFLEDYDEVEAMEYHEAEAKDLALINTIAIFFMEYHGLKTIDDELTLIEQLYPEVTDMNYLVDSIAIDYLDTIYGENCLEPFKTELFNQLGI